MVKYYGGLGHSGNPSRLECRELQRRLGRGRWINRFRPFNGCCLLWGLLPAARASRNHPLFSIRFLSIVISRLAMVLAGSLSLLKWRDSLKATCWSKLRQKLVTRSYSHSNRLMALRSKYLCLPRSMGNSYTKYPPPRWLKYHRYMYRYLYVHWRNLGRTLERFNR